MLEMVGMQELVDKLNKMQDAGKKVGNKALNVAGNIVKEAEVEEAKKHDKYSQGVGWKEIKKYSPKATRKGARIVDIGLKATRTANQKKKEANDKAKGVKRATHWDKIRGLYFNNYGFYHNRTGEYVAGSDWMGKAYDKSADEAYEAIRLSLLKEMEL